MGISLPTESAMVLKGLCSISALPSGTMGKNPPANAGDASDIGSIPGSGRSPGVGNANPLQYSWLGNPMDRRSLMGYSPWDHREWDATKHLSTKTLR